jgi:hypothetical protein
MLQQPLIPRPRAGPPFLTQELYLKGFRAKKKNTESDIRIRKLPQKRIEINHAYTNKPAVAQQEGKSFRG